MLNISSAAAQCIGESRRALILLFEFLHCINLAVWATAPSFHGALWTASND